MLWAWLVDIGMSRFLETQRPEGPAPRTSGSRYRNFAEREVVSQTDCNYHADRQFLSVRLGLKIRRPSKHGNTPTRNFSGSCNLRRVPPRGQRPARQPTSGKRPD